MNFTRQYLEEYEEDRERERVLEMYEDCGDSACHECKVNQVATTKEVISLCDLCKNHDIEFFELEEEILARYDTVGGEDW